MSVAWAKLDYLLTRVQDGVPVHLDETYQTVGILNRGRGLFRRPAISGAATNYPKFYRISAGQLVYSKLFAWEGSIAVVAQEFDGACVSPEFPTFELDQDRVLPEYLSHVVGWADFTERLAASTTGLGQRRQRVNVDDLVQIEVPLPEIDEQRRIAAHLGAVSAATQRVRLASEQRQQALGRALPPAADGQRRKVGDLVTATPRPRRVKLESSYRMLGVRWYGGGLFVRETRSGRELSAKTVYDVVAGDLVYNRLFAWKESFAIAQPEIVGTVSNEFPSFLVDDRQVIPSVLLALLLSHDFTRQVNDSSTGSTPTSRNRLKERDFLELEVSVPPMPVQGALADMLAGVRMAQALHRRVDTLSTSLLPAARNEIFSAMR